MKDAISADDLSLTMQPPPGEEPLYAPAEHAVTIAVGGAAITVRFDDERWASGFAQRYADMLVPNAAGLVHYAVHTRAGYLFWSPGGPGWSWDHGLLSVSAVVFLAEATALAALIRSSSQLVSFHAAAVAYGGVAAAIAGDTAAGKTTTAIACGRRGMGLYSDERCVVSESFVVPFARTLQLRGDGLRLLADERVDGDRIVSAGLPIREGREDVSVRISSLFGPSAIPAPAPLRAVFLLSGREVRPRVERAEWFDIAPALVRWMDSKDQGLRRVGRLADTLRDACCFRLFLGSPDASASLVGATLAELRPAHAR
jgi:hypothetical protein